MALSINYVTHLSALSTLHLPYNLFLKMASQALTYLQDHLDGRCVKEL